jgi:3-oxoadipate enol-lactonase
MRRTAQGCVIASSATLLFGCGTRPAVAAHASGSPPVCSKRGNVSDGLSQSGVSFSVAGEGPPLIVVHGFSVDRRMWSEHVAIWRRQFCLVLIDLRSHGQSAALSTRYEAAADILGVVDALHIDRFAVVGHSAGAAVGIDVALRAPERVAALVLLSPSVTGFRATRRGDMTDVAARARAGDPHGAAEAWLTNPVMSVSLPRARKETFRQMVRDNWRVWLPNAGSSPGTTPPAAYRMSQLKQPMLIVSGANDPSASSEVARALQLAQPTATVLQLPRLGHWFPLEAPQRVASMTLQFLREHTRRGRWAGATQSMDSTRSMPLNPPPQLLSRGTR